MNLIRDEKLHKQLEHNLLYGKGSLWVPDSSRFDTINSKSPLDKNKSDGSRRSSESSLRSGSS